MYNLALNGVYTAGNPVFFFHRNNILNKTVLMSRL